MVTEKVKIRLFSNLRLKASSPRIHVHLHRYIVRKIKNTRLSFQPIEGLRSFKKLGLKKRMSVINHVTK
jgi:hypothetical protein